MLGRKAMIGATLAIALLLLGATVIAIPDNGGLADSPWPMFLHDPQHTGCSPYNSPSTPALMWSYATGGGVSTPSIDPDGTVYIASKGLYALTPDGILKWR